MADCHVAFAMGGQFCPLVIVLHCSQQVNEVTRLEAEEATPYVGEALRALRAEVGNQAAVLGCGLHTPYLSARPVCFMPYG